MKGPEVLPNRFGDAIVTQAKEELLSKDAGKSESDIPRRCSVRPTVQVVREEASRCGVSLSEHFQENWGQTQAVVA